MLVPLSWLKEFVNIDMPADEFAQKMAVMGTNVETVEHLAAKAQGIITVLIKKMEKHPQADKLFVCSVFDSLKDITVVTAAKNVSEGDVVAYAPEGAVLYDGTKMGSRDFKGILSHGMFCSSEEMGLASKISPKHLEGGVYIFPAGTKPGLCALEELGRNDSVIDFELTNNRQDCNSIIGIAYEAGAAMGEKFKMPEFSINDKKSEIEDYLRVNVADSRLCPRYMARVMKVKKIEPSPLWMQRRLMSCNIRPISNIVDVSNYVLLELSQPLHMFDYDCLKGHEINVRPTKKGEKIVTLDGVERTLGEGTIAICDAERIACIGGVMGGENSEITNDTKMIVIESALFDKNAIRRTSRELGLRSDASSNFEKGISISTQPLALDRAAQLLMEIGACEPISGKIDVVDSSHEGLKDHIVTLSTQDVNRLSGMEIPEDRMRECLELLDFDVEVKEGLLTVKAPPFRQDISIKEDVIEEIVRIYGYDKIPLGLMEDSSYVSPPNALYAKRLEVKRSLIGLGGYELLTYSFISPTDQDALLIEGEAGKDCIRVLNPLGEENSVMRTSLLANMFNALAFNQSRKNDPKLLFEISRVFDGSKKDANGLPVERENLALGKSDCDFFTLKAVVAHLLKELRIPNVEYKRSIQGTFHPGKSADIFSAETKIGVIGVVHPTVAEHFGLKGECVVAELFLDELFPLSNDKIVCSNQAKFPAMARDLSVMVEDEVLSGDIVKSIKASGCKYLESARVFDVYKGPGVETGKKSVSVTMYFRSPENTLTFETTQGEFDLVLEKLKKDFGAVQR